MNKFLLLRLICSFQFLFVTSVLLSQNVVTVTDCNLQGWTRQLQANTSLLFKNEPVTTIIGKGSMEFVTLTNGFVRFRNTNFHNTLLSSLTELSFSCFIKTRENTLDANYLVLQIDKNGDGLTDDRLEFDPRFQTGKYILGIAPDQGVTQVGLWQTWDAFRGGWWIGPEPDPDANGEMFTLATYISRNPNARIVNDAALGGGGIRLSAGAPFPLFAKNYSGYADNFRIGVNGNTTIYDFEFTTADAGTDKSIVYGYGSNCISLTGQATGGVAPYTYSWSPGGETPNSISTKVCPTSTTTYTLTVTDKNGCARTDEIIVYVNDVRCGNKMDKVSVCHNGEQICIATESVPAHLQHGDILGTCNSNQSTSARMSTDIKDNGLAGLKLSNYPNPFSNTTLIKYTLPYDGKVTMYLYDITGTQIKALLSSEKKAGEHTLNFSSKELPAGLYYYKITSLVSGKYFSKTQKLLITH